MAITGATFNFNKTVTQEEAPSTPDQPTDGAKLETKVAGEKSGKQNTKDMINLSIVHQALKTTISNAVQNVEGSQLSAQASALQSGVTSVVSMVFMAATNPYALLATIACQGISYAFKAEKFNRQKAWEEYDLEEYRAARGYSAATNRSRNV